MKGEFTYKKEDLILKMKVKKTLDKNDYLIDNPNYRFKQYEKDINLFRYCKLG